MTPDSNRGVWTGAPRPATMTEDLRGRQIYLVAAEVARALAMVPGWQTERSGVCVAIRFEGHGVRKHGESPDYLIWVEDAVDQHLHKAIETGVRNQISKEQRS